jgi:hypothetical protein
MLEKILVILIVCFSKDMYKAAMCKGRPVHILPLQPGGQSSGLQIQRSWFDSWHYQIFWELVGLDRGPLSLVNTTEELLERKSSRSSVENREYSLGIRHADHVSPSIRKKLQLSAPTSGGRSVGIVHSPTQATEFSLKGKANYLSTRQWRRMGSGCTDPCTLDLSISWGWVVGLMAH